MTTFGQPAEVERRAVFRRTPPRLSHRSGEVVVQVEAVIASVRQAWTSWSLRLEAVQGNFDRAETAQVCSERLKVGSRGPKRHLRQSYLGSRGKHSWGSIRGLGGGAWRTVGV
jgi:hypothetical protein